MARPRRLIAFVLALLLPLSLPASAQEAPAPAGFVIIVADDLGWSDLGAWGNDFIDTPNIDRLAAEGMRFVDFYAPSPLCSPSRAALETGLHPVRTGFTDHLPGYDRRHAPLRPLLNERFYLDPDLTTIADVLSGAGYATAQFGKWHLALGAFWDIAGPEAHGYAATERPTLIARLRMRLGGPAPFQRWLREAGLEGHPDPLVFRTDYQTALGEAFLEDHADDPFLLVLSYNDPHTPIRAREDLVLKYRGRAAAQGVTEIDPVYAAMVEQVDMGVGRIDAALAALGLREDTVVMVLSDNGGLEMPFWDDARTQQITTNAPLRGQKGTLYEGGIRVPLILRWPAGIAPGETDALAWIPDLFPTVLGLAGIEADLEIDGIDLSRLLTAGEALPDRALPFHFPHYHNGPPMAALRRGEFKLVELFETGAIELYDLAQDIGETRDLAAERPELAAELHRELRAWREALGVAVPQPNPEHDPARAGEFVVIGP